MMKEKELFETFEKDGKLTGPQGNIPFAEKKWNAHPTFEGVELKHIVTAQETNGAFSYHLVRIAPGKVIGSHKHVEQLETHEVIGGSGFCTYDGKEYAYEPGTIMILPKNELHEVTAGEDGLYLFAKFMPALC